MISLKTFGHIVDFIRPVAPAEFVFSGGEPLMDADRLKEMIQVIDQENLARYISVQTNATLLDAALMQFFLERGVNLEVGIDGDEPTTQRNRPGIGPYFYKDIVRGVELVLGSKGFFTTTMVVHPTGVSKMFENLKYLAAMGLTSIEAHPAFLEVWNKESSDIFVDQYRQICAWELKEGKHGLIGRGYSKSSPGSWDLLSVPSGKILTNWLLLSFPEEVREELYVMDFSQNASGDLLPQGERYFKALDSFLSEHPRCSYRSISNFNAMQAVKTSAGARFEERVRNYIDLCERIETIDQKIMGTNLWRASGTKVY